MRQSMHIHNEENKQNHVLKTTAFNECHNEQHLSIFLHEVCYEWKFEGENPALVTDNARDTLPARAGAEMLPHVRCIANMLNLSFQKNSRLILLQYPG